VGGGRWRTDSCLQPAPRTKVASAAVDMVFRMVRLGIGKSMESKPTIVTDLFGNQLVLPHLLHVMTS
jgi:hypothetical protein